MDEKMSLDHSKVVWVLIIIQFNICHLPFNKLLKRLLLLVSCASSTNLHLAYNTHTHTCPGLWDILQIYGNVYIFLYYHFNGGRGDLVINLPADACIKTAPAALSSHHFSLPPFLTISISCTRPFPLCLLSLSPPLSSILTLPVSSVKICMQSDEITQVYTCAHRTYPPLIWIWIAHSQHSHTQLYAHMSAHTVFSKHKRSYR